MKPYTVCQSVSSIEAANNLLDTVPYELRTVFMPYPRFIWYTVICSLIALKSVVVINKKVVKCPEILEVLHSNLPAV